MLPAYIGMWDIWDYLLRDFVTDLVTRPSGRIEAESYFLFLPILLILKELDVGNQRIVRLFVKHKVWINALMPLINNVHLFK
jgi:hypothetical protein